MRELPILFSPEMALALLTGRKTQTRRLAMTGDEIKKGPWLRVRGPGVDHGWQVGLERYNAWRSIPVRYAVGDRLYVREHWRIGAEHDGTKPRLLEPRSTTVFYEAGGSCSNGPDGWRHDPRPEPAGALPDWVGKARRAMHMPRWASRLTLAVTEVRVERLSAISEADAIAEGLEQRPLFGWGVWRADGSLMCGPHPEPVGAYRCVWTSINGEGSWEDDPLVAAYTFTVHHRNIDDLAK